MTNAFLLWRPSIVLEELVWEMIFKRFPFSHPPQGFVELDAEIQLEAEDVLRMIPPRGHVPQQLSVVPRYVTF